MVEKATLGLNINVVRYMDDFRVVSSVAPNSAEDRALLNVQLEYFKSSLEDTRH